MSAYIVANTHIDAPLTAGLYQPWCHYGPLRWFDSEEFESGCFQEGEPWGPESHRWFEQHRRELTTETAGQVGAMLWAENRRSVNHRYAEDEWEEPYVFDRLLGVPAPVDTLKAIDGFEYQSCEHPTWRRSEAFAFCEALRRHVIRRLPGYNESDAWHVTDRHVFDVPGRR
jgi:hypothetical protein